MAVNSPGAYSKVSFSTCSSSRRCSESTADDTADECQEPYFKLCPAPSPSTPSPTASAAPPNNFSRISSQSVKRKPIRKCKDLSHFNSVPPVGHMSRSSSNTFSPSLSLVSPSESPSSRSYQLSRSPQEPRSPNRFSNRSPSEPKSPRFTPKSPSTPTSNSHFNFPPSPTFSAKSPSSAQKQRKFSFSGGPKSPMKSPKSRSGGLARSPSIESATGELMEECSTMATSLSRPSSPRGLAYLASRRGSRESNVSNVSNEDVAPLNFNNTARGRQRRTSNFLELPGK